MKKQILFPFFLLGVLTSFAQNSNWGWGLTTNLTQNGSSITYSVFDPIQNQTRSETQTNISTHIVSDGVVAWVTSGSTVGGAIYDINDHAWKSTTFNSNTGNLMLNSKGVIAWVSASGTVGGATYDPNQKIWEYTTFNSNTGNNILNNNGVIAWVSDAGTVGGAVYDPSLQNWKYTTFNSNTGNVISSVDGVIAWVSAAGTVGGAIYDPEMTDWRYTTFNSNSGNSFTNNNGIIAWISTGGTVGGAVYDHDLNDWKYNTFNSNSSNQFPTIYDGTILWNSSNSSYRYGYNFNSKSWQNDYNTDPHCKFFVSDPSGNAPFISYFWCLTIGSSSTSYACGDGHSITRRWAWKQYTNAGNYTPILTIFCSNTNSTCEQQIQVNGTAKITETEENKPLLSISPNPVNDQDEITISGSETIYSIRITDYLGKEIFSQSELNKNAVKFLPRTYNLQKGIYFLDIQTQTGLKQNKTFIVE